MAHVPPFDMPRDEIRAMLDEIRHPFRVAIDRAKNPFNIGAIIRVAHSFLVREIFLIGSEPYYERASMGMQKYETIVDCPDEASFLAAIAEIVQTATGRELPRKAFVRSLVAIAVIGTLAWTQNMMTAPIDSG